MLDTNGVVVDNVSYAINDRARILEKINEHYGTSFTGWSDNEIGLRVGDTLPDWDAYEKIEMQIPYYAVSTGGVESFAPGILVDKVWHIYGSIDDNIWGINSDGLIKEEIYRSSSYITNTMLPLMRNSGLIVESYVIEIIDWNIGQTIPNIQKYNFIT